MTERRAHDVPCPPRRSAVQKARSDIAGVFVHATAVRNLMERDAVTELGFPAADVFSRSHSRRSSPCAACLLAPGGAVLTWFALTAAYAAVAVSTFVHALALPLTEPALAGLAALAMMIGYRFVVADREERFLRKSFALYLAPEVINSMVSLRQDARARRRDAQHHHVLLGPQWLFVDRREDDTGRAGRIDERISVRHDRHHRKPWRLCRQIYRRFHRRHVRRSGRRSRARPQRRSRRAEVPRQARRAQCEQRRFRRPRPVTPHRAQQRRGRGRQYRLDAAASTTP